MGMLRGNGRGSILWVLLGGCGRVMGVKCEIGKLGWRRVCCAPTRLLRW
jgi:hypothetical protein